MVKRSVLAFGKAWFFTLLSTVAVSQKAHSVERGDIILVGMQTSGDLAGGTGYDSFTFATLVDLAPGTRIYFTDTGTDGSKFFESSATDFNGKEGLGFFEVSAGHLLRAGTVVSSASMSDASFVWKKISDNGSISVLAAGESLLGLSSDAAGDQVYAFQSTASLPTTGNPLFEASAQNHLSAIGTNSSWSYSAGNSNSTALPTSLNVAPAPFVYRSDLQKSGATYFNSASLGSTLRSKAQWHTELDKDANWSRNASSSFVLPTSSFAMAGGLSLSWKGGSGSWDGVAANWKDSSGNTTRFLPQDHVSFSGTTGGTVSVDSAGVIAGTFTISNSAGSYDLNGGQISATSLLKSGAGSATVANALSLSGSVTVTEGTLTLSGSNNYSGTSLNGGTLVAGNNAALASQRVTFNGGALGSDADSRILTNPITVNTVSGNKISGEHSLSLTGGADGAGTLQVAFDTSTPALTVSGASFAPAKIDVNKGSLLLGASNVLGDSTKLQLSGGALNTGGFSDSVGALTLTFDSVLDLGTGASVLQFANSRNEQWTGVLLINNWSGSMLGGGTDRVFFGSSFTDQADAGLSAGQLQAVFFYEPFGAGSGYYSAQQRSDGEVVPYNVVPVPEPNTLFAGALLLAFLGWHEPRRLRRRLGQIG